MTGRTKLQVGQPDELNVLVQRLQKWYPLPFIEKVNEKILIEWQLTEFDLVEAFVGGVECLLNQCFLTLKHDVLNDLGNASQIVIKREKVYRWAQVWQQRWDLPPIRPPRIICALVTDKILREPELREKVRLLAYVHACFATIPPETWEKCEDYEDWASSYFELLQKHNSGLEEE